MPAAPPHPPDFIALRDLARAFGGVTAVDGVSLEIGRGEFFSLLGPSGCGKTTLMRMIAGFETPDRGAILIDGADMLALPPHLRPVNMMFQNYALFPHMSVEANIAFGLKQLPLERAAIRRRTLEMLDLTQLTGLEKRKPDQLSGGQRQRVALARALARNPKVLLLDEPLAALDRTLRKQTQAELKRIQADSGTTFIVVTHDQEEAMALSSRMAVMRAGMVVQTGTPSQIYDHPLNRYVAGFVGEVNLLPARAATLSDGRIMADVEGVQGTVTLAAAPCPASQSANGEGLSLALRPESLRLALSDNPACDHWMSAHVEDRAHLGAAIAFRVRLEGGTLLQALVAAHAPDARHLPGADLRVGFRAADARLLGD
jgi:putrescine transport system ATP-binding protein